MNKTVEIVLLGLLLSAPFMHGMEGREVSVKRTPVGASLLGIPDDMRKLILSHLCASQDPVEAIKSLLSLRMTCREWNKYLQQNLEELFFDAARDGNIEGVKVLLNAGIDINAQNKHGNTALHRAAFGEKINVVQLLLAQESINPNIQNNAGNTALMMVLFWCPRATAIHMTYSCYIEVAKLLLNIGVDLNLQDRHGRTALHYAAYNEDINVVQLFLAKESVDLNLQDNCENTALQHASKHGRTEIANLLRQAEAQR